jgi:peptide/nickel transport system substrate-binding protein
MSKRLMGMLAIAALTFAACSSSSTPSPTAAPATSASAAAPTPAATLTPHTLIMGEWQPPTQLNPFFTSSFGDFETIQPAMRGFLTIDSKGNYQPDLAVAVPSSANGGLVIDADGKGMTINIQLKPNLKWSDGQPLNGADFAYTVTWAQDPTQNGCIACASGFTTIDPTTKKPVNLLDKVTVGADGVSIAMHFNQLYASWLAFLTGPATILPQHYMKNFAIADAATKSMPLSAAAAQVPWSGPYMITAASTSEVDYAINPYWAGGVQPTVTNLKFVYFTDKAGMISAFKTGAIDLALDMTTADAKDVQATDASIGKAEVSPAWQYEHFDMNNASTSAPFLGDASVRKAIYESVDKQSIIDTVFPGAGVLAACSAVPPGLWYQAQVTCPTYNPTDAKSLLDAAGLTVGSNGLRAYKGKTVDLLLCTTSGNPTRLTELQKLQGYLQAIGLKSHIQTVDATSVLFASWADTAKTPTKPCQIYRGTYDIADFAYILTGSPYNDYYPAYGSDQWPDNNQTLNQGVNTTRFKSDAMDAALLKVKTDVDQQSQIADMVAVQQAYVDGLPEIPIYYRAETTGVGVHLGGWPGYNPSSIGPTWDPEAWTYVGS